VDSERTAPPQISPEAQDQQAQEVGPEPTGQETARPSSRARRLKSQLRQSGYGDQLAQLAPPSPPPDSGPGATPGVEEAFTGGGAPLPPLDRIQSSFGPHDLSGVRAFVGGPAAAAAAELGALAFTRGEQVAFVRPPDLRTAAHEAAHVVQQRQGGAATPGAQQERQADAGAEAVSGGGNAVSLLGAKSQGGSPRTAEVQCKPDPAATDEAAPATPTPSPERAAEDARLAKQYAEGGRAMELEVRYGRIHGRMIEALRGLVGFSAIGAGKSGGAGKAWSLRLEEAAATLTESGRLLEAAQEEPATLQLLRAHAQAQQTLAREVAAHEGALIGIETAIAGVEAGEGAAARAMELLQETVAALQAAKSVRVPGPPEELAAGLKPPKLPKKKKEKEKKKAKAKEQGQEAPAKQADEGQTAMAAPAAASEPTPGEPSPAELLVAPRQAARDALAVLKGVHGDLAGWQGAKSLTKALTAASNLVQEYHDGGAMDQRAEGHLQGEHATAKMKSGGKVEQIDLSGGDLSEMWSILGILDFAPKTSLLADENLTPAVRKLVEDAVRQGIDGKPYDGAAEQIAAALTGQVPEAAPKLQAEIVKQTAETLRKIVSRNLRVVGDSATADGRDALLQAARARGNKLAQDIYAAGQSFPGGPSVFFAHLAAGYKHFGIADPFSWYESGLTEVDFLGQKGIKVTKEVAGSLVQAGRDYYALASGADEQPFSVQPETGSYNFRAGRGKSMKGVLCGADQDPWKSYHGTGRAIDVNYGSSKGGKQNTMVTDKGAWLVVEAVLRWRSDPQKPHEAAPLLTAEEMSARGKNDDIMERMRQASELFRDPHFTAWQAAFPGTLFVPAESLPPGKVPTRKEYEAALPADLKKQHEARVKEQAKLDSSAGGVLIGQAKRHRDIAAELVKAAQKSLKAIDAATTDAAAEPYRTVFRAQLEQTVLRPASLIEGEYKEARSQAAAIGTIPAYRPVVEAGEALEWTTETVRRTAELQVKALEALAAAAPAAAPVPAAEAGGKKGHKKHEKKTDKPAKTYLEVLRGVPANLAPTKAQWPTIAEKQKARDALAAAEAKRSESAGVDAARMKWELEVIDAFHRTRKSFLGDFAKNGFLDIPASLVTAMERNGWRWGGRWGGKSSADFMHIETDN